MIRRCVWIGLLGCAISGAPVGAQEQSVRPGINKPYEDPNIEESIKRFERENREVFRRRLEVLAVCRLKPGMCVADVGAGTGLFTRLFADAVGPQGRVYAIDIAKKFVEYVEKTCREAKLANVTGMVGKPDAVELPPESVDLVFLCDTYHHFEFPQKMLAGIHRALRPGGRLVLIDYRRIEGQSPEWILKHMRGGEAEFTQEIEAAGFQKLDEPIVLKENYLLRFERVKP